ncbi:hypothetical protein D7X33_22010, partial [Butyricicoccus sp. 1XD8-22]
MSKVDQIYKDLILDIYNNGVWDKDGEVRTKYEDGSPAYTKSTFGKQVVFEEGDIPLLTTKHVGWKTAFKEMYLFWIQQTVKKEDFDKLNVRVWDEWFLPNDTLGKSYAYQFESRPEKDIIKVKKKLKAKLNHKNNNEPIKILHHEKNHELCGSILKSNNYGDFKIISFMGQKEDGKSNFKIQFLDTGNISTATLSNINRGNVKDKYSTKKCFNVGYYGDAKNPNLSKKSY